jgi:hypothetical protein
MSRIKDVLNLEDFSPEEIDLSALHSLMESLPRSGILDLNIAEQGLVITLEAQNLCQEKIALLDRYIGLLETKKNKLWSDAALNKSKAAGHKTAKDKEWFAQLDDDFILASNNLTMAKATKKWFENKASYFFGWHYTFKTFLKRDYTIERSSNLTFGAFDFPEKESNQSLDVDTNDIEWDSN